MFDKGPQTVHRYQSFESIISAPPSDSERETVVEPLPHLHRPRRRPVTTSQARLLIEFDDCTCTDVQILITDLCMAVFVVIVMFVYWDTFGV